MSLNVYLETPGESRKYEARIFVREDGQTMELTRREWDERFPGREPVTMQSCETEDVFHANITHNLGAMANAAGIYEAVWRPDEHGITKARQLIEPLRAGIAKMEAAPQKFEQFNAKNGWGLYVHFLPWLKRYLAACEESPDADVRVSR